MLDQENTGFNILGYDNQYINVNQITYPFNLFIMRDQLIAPWGPQSFEKLMIEHFDALFNFQFQVLLIGTGITQRFLDPTLQKYLLEKNIGAEVMNTAAACRTYTLLKNEGRKVAACLFL